MNERGINTLYGRWLIEGAPRVLLFDTGSAYKFLNEWKGDLWNIAGIPSPDGDHESNEAIVFGYLVAWFLGEVRTKNLRWLDQLSFTNRFFTVCMSRYKTGRRCTFPRVARQYCPPSLQETPN